MIINRTKEKALALAKDLEGFGPISGGGIEDMQDLGKSAFR